MIKLVLLLQMVLGLWSVFNLPITQDEPDHIASGIAHWTAGHRKADGVSHPPLTKMIFTAPAALMGADKAVDCSWDHKDPDYTRCARSVFYDNKISPKVLLLTSRLVVLFISLLFTYFVFVGFGPWPALLVSTCPSLIANSTVATTDFLFTAFFFLTCWAWAHFDKKQYGIYCINLAVVSACLITSKFTALLVLPICFIIFELKQMNRRRGINCLSFVFLAEHLTLLLIVFIYGGDLASFGRLIYQQAHHSILRINDISNWWLPVLVFIKTPIPLVICGMMGFYYVIKNRGSELVFYWLTPLLVFIVSIIVYKLHIYSRYVLFLWPVMCVFGGLWLEKQHKFLKLAMVGWMLAVLIPFKSNYFAFTNVLSPGCMGLTGSDCSWEAGK